ncbi:hypothetical protein [Pseudoalteromonas sp. PPB1]|uniref:hypothetical protein n=1 Tax=Pseudoalteromonas sp. PPB1 TaxID=2756136 RepID=UPI001890F765|nr:hypothetical protein [Pseudoalteromonas sp. PPB1]
MENWPIYLVLLLVHLLVFASSAYAVLSCPIRTAFEKMNLVLLALLVPIFGSIIVHNILQKYVKLKGQWVNVSDGTYLEPTGSKDGSATSDIDGDSGGSGAD